MILYGKCPRCKKNKFILRKRKIVGVPPVPTITSKEEICRKCIKIMTEIVKQGKA